MRWHRGRGGEGRGGEGRGGEGRGEERENQEERCVYCKSYRPSSRMYSTCTYTCTYMYVRIQVLIVDLLRTQASSIWHAALARRAWIRG